MMDATSGYYITMPSASSSLEVIKLSKKSPPKIARVGDWLYQGMKNNVLII